MIISSIIEGKVSSSTPCMKKIFFTLFLFWMLFIAYQGISIWSVIGTESLKIGRIQIYDRDGNLLTNLPKEWWYSMNYTDHFDYTLIQSILQIEDRRFFSHFWVDIIGKIWALKENYSAWFTVRWGSTITEQYIKNTYFPHEGRNVWQKIQESFWAILLEIRYTKEEILRKYLDTIYMGNGIYWVETALETYFPEEKIWTLSEGAIIEIITRIKYPNLSEGSENYKNTIQRKLWLTELSEALPKRGKPQYTDIFPFLTNRLEWEIHLYCLSLENHLSDYVLTLPQDICKMKDLVLSTSIDMNITLEAATILEGTLFPLEEKNVHNGSIYVWSEKEKKVLAYVGNRINARENAIDMITKKRSVGSVLKPFVYEMMIEKWASPESLILDDTRVYETEVATQSYIPENYIPKSYWPITLREALGNSLNSASVRLSEKIGIWRIYEKFRSLWFDLDHEAWYYWYGIVLWAIELSLENIVHGYRSLTSLEKDDKFLLFEMLSNPENRAQTFWISSILNTSIPLAVKTWTSSDFRDNWVIGYNNDIIIWVWVWNTTNESMDDISWITGAGPIYHAIAENMILRWYIRPLNISMPTNIAYTLTCLDIRCLQKNSSYIPVGWSRKSRPASHLYYKEDFVTDITTEEQSEWKIQ